MIGRTLSHYKIFEKIGEGGMGEVYLAQDTKLDREVAIKVLPSAFSQNEERLARFEREARLLASLNHPNIAVIHGIEESDGVHFLVLEYIPGETLADRIKRGPIEFDEALPLFKQIAEGLAAAHEKGVIHRDLKPANIKITPEGKIKVLDFGLAKALVGDKPVQDLSESPTIAKETTGSGTLLGTAAYMSPEQARGKAVDKRADIWAFGCILYEALTSRKAFYGDTVSDTLVSILEREPDWPALPDSTPASVHTLLQRCVRKDEERRFRDVWDVRVEIEDAITGPSPSTASGHTLETTQHARAISRKTAGLTAVLLTIATALAVWSLLGSRIPIQKDTKHLIVNILPTGQFTAGPGHMLALSPDGTRLVYLTSYSGESQLFLRSLDRLRAELIPGTENAHHPFFSPDSQWIGFFSEGKLKKVSVNGGAPFTVCEVGSVPRGASWASDGRIFFATEGAGLSSVSDSGGTPQSITKPDPDKGEIGHRWPEVLPDGKAVLYTAWMGQSYDEAIIMLVALQTGERRILLEGGTNPVYAPSGHVVFARSRALLAVPFDARNLEVTGPPATILDNLLVRGGGAALFSLSSEGSLSYVPPQDTDKMLVSVDRDGNSRPLTEEPRGFGTPRISPDGQRVAVVVHDWVENDIWMLDKGRASLTRLTFEGNDVHPAWSPDGNWLAFTSNRAGQRNLFLKPTDGSGAAERLTTNEFEQYAACWSPDGRFLVYVERRPLTDYDILLHPLDGEDEPREFAASSFREISPSISHDGKWIAYVTNESGRNEVYVQAFPNPAGKVQVSNGGGVEPLWDPKAGSIYYRNGDKLMVVSLETEPVFTAAKPDLLFEGNFARGSQEMLLGQSDLFRRYYDIDPDGNRFVMLLREEVFAPSQINIVLNWFQELNRLVPTN